MDIINGNNKKTEEKKNESIILPKGWHQCFTNDGKAYYMDHNTKSTHWSIPNEAYWTGGDTVDGKVYFKNHKNKTTHWKLPNNLDQTKIKKGDNESKPTPKYVQMNNYQPPISSTIDDLGKAFNKMFVSPIQRQFEKQYNSNYDNYGVTSRKPQKSNVNKLNYDKHEDTEFWKKLAFECNASGDFGPYWNEIHSSNEWKNANQQKRQAITIQIEQMINENKNIKQSMIMNQMQHNARMNNMMHNTFAEVNDMNYCQLMNNSQWGDNKVHYSLNPDYEYNAKPYGPF